MMEHDFVVKSPSNINSRWKMLQTWYSAKKCFEQELEFKHTWNTVLRWELLCTCFWGEKYFENGFKAENTFESCFEEKSLKHSFEVKMLGTWLRKGKLFDTRITDNTFEHDFGIKIYLEHEFEVKNISNTISCFWTCIKIWILRYKK